MKVARVGDGNNVAASWIQAAGILGFELVIACPGEFAPDLSGAGANVSVVTDPKKAVKGAHSLNTDVWISMGHDKNIVAAIQVLRINPVRAWTSVG